ncbi:hypothetical protein A2769_00450 [Candidatus Daviesbacteria bacterium RIFCSPHIGHO2_01_FULL_37_27]|nr:MAG: hypothetical protein A2769_00450 [Candidatus Daviesbacteria bacterium RIFCSPHIGHO2_01_FULL_37_27]
MNTSIEGDKESLPINTRRDLLRRFIPNFSIQDLPIPATDLRLPISRGHFILASALSPLFFAACTREHKNGSYHLEDLKKELGTTSLTTRMAFTEKASQIVLENPNWMVGKTVEYRANLGKTVLWRIDEKGEPKAANFDYKSTIAYPDSRVPGFKDETRRLTFQNDRHFIVYGITETVNKITAQSEIVQNFLREYYHGVNYPAALHLVFLPRSHEVQLIDITGHGKLKLGESNVGITGIAMPDNKIARMEVAIVVPGIHFEAINTGASLKSKLINVLANEVTSVLFSPSVRPKVGVSAHVPQAITSIAGMIAEVDDKFAQMILGGKAYDKFCDVVVQEMNRIGQVINTN